MKDGGFGLRKWTSNSRLFRERVAMKEHETKLTKPCNQEHIKITKPLGSDQDIEVVVESAKFDEENNRELVPRSSAYSQDIAQPVALEKQSTTDFPTQDNHSTVKILGTTWNTDNDEFEYEFSELVSFLEMLPSTQRSVLRLTAKIFDPLGLLAPFTIVMKMLFQTLCLDGTKWDDPLAGELLDAWNQIINDLRAMKPIRVSRCYFSCIGQIGATYELHGFSDASSKAYAAVVYLRTVKRSGEIEVSLIASKTRVAPIKRQSIPRLELLGATILARLVNSIQKALTSLPLVPEVFLWTDSYTVLCWVRNDKAWKPYVQNRINEIRKLTDVNSWKFCPGEENPADLPSRGIRGPVLAKTESWWNGAEFLKFPKKMWPSEPGNTENEQDEANLEVIKPKTAPAITRSLTSATTTNLSPNVELVIDCNRYSTKTKLLRVTARVMRFIKNLRGCHMLTDELTVDELNAAEKLWIRSIQESSYKDEMRYLSQDREREPLLVKQLGLFKDQENLIRCRGRIDESSVFARETAYTPFSKTSLYRSC